MADGSPPAQVAPPRRRGAGRWFLSWLVVAAVIGVASAALFRLPYYALAPGSVQAVSELVVVEQGPTFPSDGEFYLATVSLRQVTVIGALVGWLDPATDVVPRDRVVPRTVDPGSFRDYNLRLMDASKQAALLVALERLGYEVGVEGSGAQVVGVVPGTPAEGVLEPGATIVAVDGHPVSLADEAVALIAGHRPGEQLSLSVEPPGGGPPGHVTLTLGEHPERAGTPFVGVSLATRDLVYQLPREVEIESERIGGPSAGLAFTLEVLDVLTPGDLSGGRKVAATGTIRPDGSVGPVGGVPQKAAAVEQAGIDLFLVPAGEVDDARAAVGGDLRVEPVDDLDDALAALDGLGGNAFALSAPEGARA